MLIRNTEPRVFAGLVWVNTRPLLTQSFMSTFRPGGMLFVTQGACFWGVVFHLPMEMYPVPWAALTLFLIMLDLMAGTARTLAWLKMLDRFGGEK